MSKDRPIRILITGSNGFIGKNLVVRLRERVGTEISTFTRSDSVETLPDLVANADAIVHLAGENRPADVADFARVNTDLTRMLCKAIRAAGSAKLLIFSSSIQAEHDNPYGQSKLAAELEVEDFARETGNPVVVYRLPGVFGKWCKPNYNSVVATFCYNNAHRLPIQVNDSVTVLHLVYIDDLINEFLRVLDNVQFGFVWGKVNNIYSITLDKLAEQIAAFRNCRTNLISERVGTGLIRALYSTYLSYLKP
jgi:UDP-2-acetamido-2,6-beta-L-arabino-hexul-4-ose reductase